MGEITEPSQTSEGSLYHYLDGKDALLNTLSLLFGGKHEEPMDILMPRMSATGKLLFLNNGLFGMVENDISLDFLTRLLSIQLAITGEGHLLDHNRTYHKLLYGIIAQGQGSEELNVKTSVNEMVELYALSERALLYNRCLCAGEYFLCRHSTSVISAFLNHFLPGRG